MHRKFNYITVKLLTLIGHNTNIYCHVWEQTIWLQLVCHSQKSTCLCRDLNPGPPPQSRMYIRTRPLGYGPSYCNNKNIFQIIYFKKILVYYLSLGFQRNNFLILTLNAKNFSICSAEVCLESLSFF